MFCYENRLTFPGWRFRSKIGKLDRFLLVSDDDKSHYVYIKDLDRFMFHKWKTKKQKIFLQKLFFSSKNVLTEHKKDCLSINGTKSVRLENGTIEFKNDFKQVPVLFKIYRALIVM